MRVLSLFSGGGLGDYGLELAGMEIVGQVEIDEYCQKILKLRWPDVPKWTDIKNVRGEEILERCGTVDLISGGFPCQPFSVAGTRKGESDKRHLWPHMARIIREVRPRWVLAENVPGLLSISDGWVFGEVVRDLAESGYCVEWDCIPASAVGAPHQRDRVWILAYSNVANSETWRLQKWTPEKAIQLFASSRGLQERKYFWKGWDTEPNVGRVAHGVPKRVDRLKLLGNGQVVQVVEWIGKRIMEFDRSLK